MKRGAERFARGELDGRLPSYSGEEMGGLAEAMNQMAAQLDDRIRTVVSQRNEQEAVLASMIEGVLAVDNEERILRINQSAADLLDIDPAETRSAGASRRWSANPTCRNSSPTRCRAKQRIEADITLMIRGESSSCRPTAHRCATPAARTSGPWWSSTTSPVCSASKTSAAILSPTSPTS